MRSGVSRAGVAATSAVVLAIVAGLFTLGTPSHAREHRLDELRIEDLARLSRGIDEYWTRHTALPATLDSLVSERQLDRVPADPKTDSAYTYLPSGERSYRLCAMFAQPSDSAWTGRYLDGVDVGARSWRHGAGKGCFDLSVPLKATK